MLTTYLRLIKEQRKEHPLHPKDYRALPLPRLLSTSDEAITNLKTRPNSILTSIIKRDIPRYSDTEDVYYYEFVELGLKSRTSFPDWQFWYIPVSKYDDLIAATNISKVPSYKIYNVQTASVDTVPTKTQPLVPFVRPNSTFYSQSYVDNLHPLLYNFVFTGYSFLDKKGFMVYEYQDYKMYADDITVTYYSLLRPTNFFIKSNQAAGYALELTARLIKFEGAPPGQLEVYTGLPDLRATGKSTTSDFSNYRKWYEYIRYIDGQPFDRILLPYAPTSLSIDFVKLELNNSSMSLMFNLTNNTQAIAINQISSNNKISIQ